MRLPLLFLTILSLFLTSCCKNCLLSRAEVSWLKTTEANKLQTTEIHNGDKYVEITSRNGGTLTKFTLDGVEIFIPQDNDMILKDIESGKSIAIAKQECYKSNGKNTVSIDGTLSNGLKFRKMYKMNLEPGDLLISRKIENELVEDKAISLVRTLSVRPEGYLIIPLSMISRYKSRYIICDHTGEISHNPIMEDPKIVNEKLIFPTKGENITLRSDASDGWFGYVLNDKMLLIKYSMPNYKKTDNPLIFTAKITQSKIDFSFGETIKTITANTQTELSERLVLVNLDKKVKTVQDVENVMKYVKISLILVR